MKAAINGVNIAYDDRGTGRPVLWVHAYPFDRTFWAGQVDALAGEGRHIVPDLRGFGQSADPEGACSMEQYADDLRGLLDTLKIDRTILVGLSMGGYIALAFVRKYAERLKGLVLADTRAGPDSPEAAQTRRDNAAKALSGGVGPVVDPLLEKLLAASTKANRPDVVASVRSMLRASRAAGVAGALLGMAGRADSASVLPGIDVPTLVVVGSEDAITPPAESRRMAEAIRDAELLEIADAGHVPNLEQADKFNEAVRSWLGRQ